MIDVQEIRTAVFLIEGEARRRGRSWDPQGLHAVVLAAVKDDGRTVDRVITAGFTVAADPAARTPAGIRHSDHYLPPLEATLRGLPLPTCRICSRTEPECKRAALIVPPSAGHAFQPSSTTHATLKGPSQ